MAAVFCSGKNDQSCPSRSIQCATGCSLASRAGRLLPIILRQDKEKHFVMIMRSLIERFPPIFSNRNEVFCDKRQRLLLNLNFFEFVTIYLCVFLDFVTIFFNVILLLEIYVGITGVVLTPIFNR